MITDDGRTMITAETQRHCLTMFDIETDGRLSNRRIFATLPEHCRPDGISLDAEGGIWAACPSPTGESSVIRAGFRGAGCLKTYPCLAGGSAGFCGVAGGGCVAGGAAG